MPLVGIRRINTNRKLLKQAEKLDDGVVGRDATRLSRMDLELHAHGARTIYVEASATAPECLVGIDIDNHSGGGTLADAILLAEALRRDYFTNLYFEPSTNGNGVHGYLRMPNPGDPEKFARALADLQVFLKRFARDGNARGLWTVEDIEVKGTPARIVRDSRGRVTNFRAGTLIKAPRGLVDRAEELMATTVVTAERMMSLKAKVKPQRSPKPSEPTILRMPATAPPSGSRGAKFFDESCLRDTREGGRFYEVARLILGEGFRERAGSGKDRKVATIEDGAILLKIALHIANQMNGDGSMPGERIGKLWSKLYEDGLVGRAFCWSRFALIRNRMSAHRYIAWTREDYRARWISRDGRQEIKGQACRWTLVPALKIALSRGMTANPEIAVTTNPGTEKPTTILDDSTSHGLCETFSELASLPPLDDYPRPRFAGWAVGPPRIAA